MCDRIWLATVALGLGILYYLLRMEWEVEIEWGETPLGSARDE